MLSALSPAFSDPFSPFPIRRGQTSRIRRCRLYPGLVKDDGNVTHPFVGSKSADRGVGGLDEHEHGGKRAQETHVLITSELGCVSERTQPLQLFDPQIVQPAG